MSRFKVGDVVERMHASWGGYRRMPAGSSHRVVAVDRAGALQFPQDDKPYWNPRYYKLANNANKKLYEKYKFL
jgi:hypothetical protein